MCRAAEDLKLLGSSSLESEGGGSWSREQQVRSQWRSTSHCWNQATGEAVACSPTLANSLFAATACLGCVH